MLPMAVMVGMAETVLMEETVRMAPSQLRAVRVVRAEQIRTRRENFIFQEQNSSAIRGSRMP
ncbi:hypothetical protein ABF55_12910 [Enterobacter asburiae]|nr:hypothetical protein YA44_16195 [Enterobacter asburiae]KLP43753.1 hypothetical protein ABF55_12910 [Enterobacter asburiae]